MKTYDAFLASKAGRAAQNLIAAEQGQTPLFANEPVEVAS